MGFLGGKLGYHLLRLISKDGNTGCDGSVYNGRSKIEILFGSQIWSELAGKVVLDFGCGTGNTPLE